MKMYRRLVLTIVRSFKRKKHDLLVNVTSFSFLICVVKLFLLISQYIFIISTLKLDLIDFMKESVMYVRKILTFEISNFVTELRYFMMRSIMMWESYEIQTDKSVQSMKCNWDVRMCCECKWKRSDVRMRSFKMLKNMKKFYWDERFRS
jgi:hypothetical protein